MTTSPLQDDYAIAIIGIACRFPGADTPETFRENLEAGVESVTVFSDEELLAAGVDRETLDDPNYVKSGTVLSHIEGFDAYFFGYSPHEAAIIDPQQRLFLECAWEALERAGYPPDTRQYAIGVWAGSGMNSYLLYNLAGYGARGAAESFQWMTSNGPDFLTTRVAYKFNLTGPAITVQTACSTSLVAVDLACQGLLDGKCDMALAGGVSIQIPHGTGYHYQEGMIASPDGHCRAFDAEAKGIMGGNGAGVVVLKRLEEALADGDTIHAVIKGSAINNDGSDKVGFTAPSVTGQALAIAEAQAIANVEPESISYIEAHGTGTALGDPIEIKALTQAFRTHTSKNGFCAIGSVKTNIGHADAAAGVAGLIKTAMALEHRRIPPSLHFQSPNPEIDFANSPFYVNVALADWESDAAPRRAGVSSFGIGGTNAHVVLEEAPERGLSGESRNWQLLPLSARTETALDAATANLAAYLEQHPDANLADVAYTLSCGRKAFEHRRMVVCRGIEDARETITSLDPARIATGFRESERSVVFMFSGHGTQYVGMGAELYESEPVFREEVDKCSAYLEPLLGYDLRRVIYPSSSRQEMPEPSAGESKALSRGVVTQPALFTIEYALVRLWTSWGVHPEAMIGHSMGEYVAACLAGVFSLKDALSLVAARERMMETVTGGAMLSVLLPSDQVPLTPGLSLAIVSAPDSCVVSGRADAIDALEGRLIKQGVECRRLNIAYAAHSEMMEPILAPFTERVAEIELSVPQIPYLSNVTGTWITAEDATDPAYWAKHLRQTVHFADGVRELAKEPSRILLEIGPGQTLATLARRPSDKAVSQVVLSSLRHRENEQSDVAFLLNTLGRLWLFGGAVDWSGFYAGERRHRLPLPTYPFERRRCWIDPPDVRQAVAGKPLPTVKATAESDAVPRHARPNLTGATYVAPRNDLERTITDAWGKSLGIEQVGIHDDFFELGGTSLLAVQLIGRLRETLGVDLPNHSLLTAPTIIALAGSIQKITAETPGRDASSTFPHNLIELQAGDRDRQPLFLVHPAGGHVYFYRDLVRCLDPEQPVYGIQAQETDGKSEPITQVEKMATRYIEVIRVRQPEGPYVLGGASFGGTVAFEMARQLHVSGEQIPLLAIIDTPGPGHLPAKEKLETDGQILAYFLAVGANVRVSAEELEKLAPDEQLHHFLGEQKKWGVELMPDMDLADARHFLSIFRLNLQMIWDYRPPRYPGKALFFRAMEGTEFNPEDPERAWAGLVQGGLEIINVPGNHITMNESPNVRVIAERLGIDLDKAKLGAYP